MLQVNCDKKAELDDFWRKLSEGGDPTAQQCGSLKGKYGVSWQIVPSIMGELMTDPDVAKSQWTMQAMLQMKKRDIAPLKRAHAG